MCEKDFDTFKAWYFCLNQGQPFLLIGLHIDDLILIEKKRGI